MLGFDIGNYFSKYERGSVSEIASFLNERSNREIRENEIESVLMSLVESGRVECEGKEYRVSAQI